MNSKHLIHLFVVGVNSLRLNYDQTLVELNEIKQFIQLDYQVRSKFLISDCVYTDDVCDLYLSLLSSHLAESDFNFYIWDKVSRLYKRYVKYSEVLTFLSDLRQWCNQDSDLFWVGMSYIATIKSYDRYDINTFMHDAVLLEDIDYPRYLADEFNKVMLLLKRRMECFYESKDVLSQIKTLRQLNSAEFEASLAVGRPFQSSALADINLICRLPATGMLKLNAPAEKRRFVQRLFAKYSKV